MQLLPQVHFALFAGLFGWYQATATERPPVIPGPQQLAAGKPDSTQRVLTSEERSAATTIETLFAAAERNDIAALDSIYAGSDLTVMESTGINRGWADYRDHHLAPEMKEMKNFRYRPFEIEPHVSGDLAWVIFRSTCGLRREAAS